MKKDVKISKFLIMLSLTMVVLSLKNLFYPGNPYKILNLYLGGYYYFISFYMLIISRRFEDNRKNIRRGIRLLAYISLYYFINVYVLLNTLNIAIFEGVDFYKEVVSIFWVGLDQGGIATYLLYNLLGTFGGVALREISIWAMGISGFILLIKVFYVFFEMVATIKENNKNKRKLRKENNKLALEISKKEKREKEKKYLEKKREEEKKIKVQQEIDNLLKEELMDGGRTLKGKASKTKKKNEDRRTIKIKKVTSTNKRVRRKDDTSIRVTKKKGDTKKIRTRDRGSKTIGRGKK